MFAGAPTLHFGWAHLATTTKTKRSGVGTARPHNVCRRKQAVGTGRPHPFCGSVQMRPFGSCLRVAYRPLRAIIGSVTMGVARMNVSSSAEV